MRYFYDCEFLVDGRTIDLISIGILAEDGRTYYAVSDECGYDSRSWPHRWFNPQGSLEKRIRRNEWLMANVIPSLPQPAGDWNLHMPKSWLFNYLAHEVKSPQRIAEEVADFLLADGTPELWADYGAYDHVVLCRLWGGMADLPGGLPMFTCDIQQEAARLGIAWDQLPQQETGLHNALADARHCKAKFDFLVQEARNRDMNRDGVPM